MSNAPCAPNTAATSAHSSVYLFVEGKREAHTNTSGQTTDTCWPPCHVYTPVSLCPRFNTCARFYIVTPICEPCDWMYPLLTVWLFRVGRFPRCTFRHTESTRFKLTRCSFHTLSHSNHSVTVGLPLSLHTHNSQLLLRLSSCPLPPSPPRSVPQHNNVGL